MRRVLIALLVVGLGACRLGELLGPQPHYVWACVRWETVVVTVNGQAFSSRTCAEYGWTRAVDTVVVRPHA